MQSGQKCRPCIPVQSNVANVEPEDQEPQFINRSLFPSSFCQQAVKSWRMLRSHSGPFKKTSEQSCHSLFQINKNQLIWSDIWHKCHPHSFLMRRYGNAPPEGGLAADPGHPGEIVSLNWPGNAQDPTRRSGKRRSVSTDII